MKKLILFTVCLFAGCELISYAPPPPVTSQMAKLGAKQHVDLATLREGRTLFVSRCIECHTLPAFWHYRENDWPEIVDSMSHRANLKRTERDAVLAYIFAARQQ
jgi:hypothetical protein